MTPARFTSSRPPEWVLPRPHRDPTLRRQHFGPLVPMDYPKRGTIRLTLLVAAALFMAGLAGRAMGWG